jgi:hypothetical protein
MQAPAEWLGRAARVLGVADPARCLAGTLDRILPNGGGSGDGQGVPGERANALLPGQVPLEVSFSEQASGTLRLDFQPIGCAASIDDRRSAATAAVRALVARWFDRVIATDFGVRAEALRAAATPDGFCAFVGAAFGTDGVTEAKLYYPSNVHCGLSSLAAEALPGLEPLMRAVAASRRRIAERVYLVYRSPLDARDVEPLLARFGVAHRLAELCLTVRRLAGSYELPAGSLVLGLRRLRDSTELKVEVLRPPITPDHFAALLAERPASRTAFDRWLRAVTGAGPLRVAVASARVTADLGVRLNAYVHHVR